MSARRRGALAPPGAAAGLVGFVSAAMCFLAMLAFAAAHGAGVVAGAWSTALDGAATVRLPAEDAAAAGADAALEAIRGVRGIVGARLLEPDEVGALLAPWLGAEIGSVGPLPRLIEVDLAPGGADAGEAQRALDLAAPGAVYDDHEGWRRPMAEAARAFRALALSALGVMGAVLAAMVAAAARASMAGAAATVRALRLLGADDGFITRAFDRPLALRALIGGAVGAPAGFAALSLSPAIGEALGADALQAPLWPIAAAPVAACIVAWITARISVTALLSGVEG